MGLFSIKKPTRVNTEPLDPQWARPPKGGYFRFVHLDPEEYDLEKASGVYVIWHGGVRPEWLYVGCTDDLASALFAAGDNDDIMEQEVRGGLFVTWAFVKKEFQGGVVKYLVDVLKPVVGSAGAKGDPVPVITP